VFNDEDGSFYCGEGYDNEFYNFQDLRDWVSFGSPTISYQDFETHQNITGNSGTEKVFKLKIFNNLNIGEKTYFYIKIRNNDIKDILVDTFLTLPVFIHSGETKEVKIRARRKTILLSMNAKE
jgi:hypothetical protein